MRRLVLAVAVLAAPAFAQGTDEEPTAAPGSIAYGMIENADANGVFELVHNGQVTVRHVGSGLVCHFARDGDGGRLVLYPQLSRGDNVGCHTDAGGVSTTLYATRFPFVTTLEEQMNGADTIIRQQYPEAQPLPSLSPIATSGVASVQYIISRNGVRTFTRTSVAIIGAWTIKMRYTASAPDDAAERAADANSAALFRATLAELGAEHS
jgi:hypothetical protein